MGRAYFAQRRSTRELLCSSGDAGITFSCGVMYCYAKAALKTLFFLLKTLKGLCLLEIIFKREMLTGAALDLFCKEKGLSLICFFISAQNNLEFCIFLYISLLYFKPFPPVSEFLGLIWVTTLGKKKETFVFWILYLVPDCLIF